MESKRLKDLRNKKNFSQDNISEKLHIAIETYRNWELGRTMPSVEDMKNLAKILEVTEEEIISIFEPEKFEKINQEQSKMHALLLELFNESDIAEHFLVFTTIFSAENISGVVYCDDYVFPFTKTITTEDCLGVVLADADDNYIILTDTNIIKVKPISSYYNIFTFDIDINCPMFPIVQKYSPNSFRQRIRISFFINNR